MASNDAQEYGIAKIHQLLLAAFSSQELIAIIEAKAQEVTEALVYLRLPSASRS